MANVPTTSWDETSPAGNTSIILGDNRIRELKTQIREVVGVDHDFPSSGQASDNGQHLRVTLQEQADLGTGATGVPILGAQTIDGNAEMVFTTEGDTDIQFTKGDYPYYSAPENVAGMAGLLNLIYPIGYVITLGVSTNPGTLLGVGTWTAIEGKVIVGIAGSGTFDTLNATGGAETVTLTAAQSGVPAHTHTDAMYNANGWASGDGVQASSAVSAAGNLTTDENTPANASEAHTNLQPYIVKYVWERVS